MNIQNMMAQAQKMQKEMQRKISEFEAKEFEFDYQNSIQIKMSGASVVLSIKIIDALIDIDDKITLEEMISEAMNEALEWIKEQKDSLMPKGMGGMGI